MILLIPAKASQLSPSARPASTAIGMADIGGGQGSQVWEYARRPFVMWREHREGWLSASTM